MIKTTGMLRDELIGYASPANKISRLERAGEITRIVRGLYETNPSTPAYLLAGSIYGPSYISFEYALSRYGLIPEHAFVVTSATFERGKTKQYTTPFGTFIYRDVPSRAFPVGIRIVEEGDYAYRIASPEKALLDTLYIRPPVANAHEMEELLLEDLRVEEEDLENLDCAFVQDIAELYRGANARRFAAYLKRQQRRKP